MDAVEIDPELFITCRICLKEKGSFQITPIIQQQITYCLDVEVQPFDGFSQVICKNCKPVLHNFYDLKKNFVEKQDILKKNKNLIKKAATTNEVTKEQPDQYVVTSSQQEESTDKNDLKVKIKRLKRKGKTSVRSTLSSDNESTNSSLKQNENNLLGTKTDESWLRNYQKYFVCRYCDAHRKSLSFILEHVQSHTNLLDNYKNIIQKHCNVSLNRIDFLPNLTGDVKNTNIVVLDSKTLLYDGNNINYYITYLPKAFQNSATNENISLIDDGMTNSKPVESSDEDTVVHLKPRKKARLLSDSDASISDFNIQDQSDKKNVKEHPKELYNNVNISDEIQINPQLTDSHKSHILGIVVGSYNKSIKKYNANKIKMNNDALNRKVLGIGRKVMFKHGFSSPGLLKYLEYKNLSVEWTSSKNVLNKENDYVRIMTNIKEKPLPDHFVPVNEIEKNDNSINTDIVDIKNAPIDVPSDVSSDITTDVPLNVALDAPLDSLLESPLDSPLDAPIDSPIDSALDTPPDVNINKETIKMPSDTTLSKSTKKDAILKIYLLNPSPVANPKQVRQKKVYAKCMQIPTESIKFKCSEPTIDQDLICLKDSDEEKSSDGMSPLPIITSTTSLAPNANIDKNIQKAVTPPITSASDASASCVPTASTSNQPNETSDQPRIKCKPVSELMDTKSYSIIKPPTPYFSLVDRKSANSGNITKPSVIFHPSSVICSTMSNTSTNSILVTKPSQNDAVTLDSGLLPFTSTTTVSPMIYFQTILQSYGLNLTDANADYRSMMCLVKFKLNIKHDTQSVFLNLGLFGVNKTFCIRVKNGNSTYINPFQMSANWQWELIRAFQDNSVLEKIQNSSKGPSEAETTKLFISVLKSIKKIANK